MSSQQYYLHSHGKITTSPGCGSESFHCTPRPVVVIDPDNREQVERLTKALNASLDFAHGSLLADAISAALADTLHAFIAPPKPAEPTGLGAVVEDADGRTWTRNDMDDSCTWRCGRLAEWRTYADIDVVKVLSAGVTA